MKKILLVFTLFLFAGCSQAGTNTTEPQGFVCTQEGKICPDGSVVGRTGLNCEFAECPASGSNERKYIEKNPEQCKVILFQCVPGMKPFFDDTGCGCEPSTEVSQAECGFLNGAQVNCEEGQMCATVEWVSSAREARCYPENICENSPCGPDAECVVMESWPAQVKCAQKRSDLENSDQPVSSY